MLMAFFSQHKREEKFLSSIFPRRIINKSIEQHVTDDDVLGQRTNDQKPVLTFQKLNKT